MAGWEPPIPFDQFQLPAFPLDVLPGWHREWVDAEATETQTPPDLAAMVSLSVVATAMAKKVEVCVRAGWTEPVNIYTVTVLPPANRKSAVFRDAARPLLKFMRDEAKRLGPAVRKAVTLHRIAAKRLKRAEEEAARAPAEQQEELEESATRLATELAAIEVPMVVRLVVDDATPERLVSLMAMHGGRMAVMSAEGGVFGMLAGRYSKDGSPNFEAFLKAWGGDEIYVDRVGREPEHIIDPALTIGLTVQPSVIHNLMEKAGFRERGLPARFFYSIPVSPVGHRQINPPSMHPEIHANYQRRIRALLELSHDTDEEGNARPHPLMLTADARAVLDRFQAELEPRLGPSGDLESISDWGGKLVGGVARNAGLLHIIRHVGVRPPWEAPIEAVSVENAVKLARYLIPHAQAAFARMGADKEVEKAKRILRWLLDKRITTFSHRDAFEARRSDFDRADDLAGPIALLMEHRFIRRLEPEEHHGPGRPPGPEYEVNPKCLTQNPQNTQNPSERSNSADFADSADGYPPEKDPALTEQEGDAEVEI